MGRVARLLVLLLVAGVAVAACGQSRPAGDAVGSELPAQVRVLLDEVADFTPGFDTLAFYAVVEHVRGHGVGTGAIVVPDWRDLMERPNAFRGVPVTVEGTVGRNKDPYTVPGRPELGVLSQLELYRVGVPVACTVIVTNDVRDIPVGAVVRITGCFVQMRTYRDANEREHYGAVLVAAGPDVITQAPPRAAVEQRWWWLFGAFGLGLLVAVVILRRGGKPARRDLRTLRASRPAPENLADDLQSWAESDDKAGERPPEG